MSSEVQVAPASTAVQTVQSPAAPALRPCPQCSREWGSGLACQFCGQVEGQPVGIQLTAPARRLGGYVLEILLATVTLGIGWLIWACVVFSRGQTPAKSVLGMRVLDVRTGKPATWGRMALREVIAKPVANLFTLGIAPFWLLWDRNNQELWDKIASSLVVNDPNKLLVR